MSKTKYLLYAGRLRPGATGLARMRAIETLGWRVAGFDVSPYFRSSYVAQRLAINHAAGPIIAAVNDSLLAAARAAAGQVDCIWIDKGVWLQPQTLLALKDITGAPVVHYTPDPHFGFNHAAQRLLCRSIRHYDLLFTTKPFEVSQYRTQGARDIRLVAQSYDEDQLFPRTLTDAERLRFRSEVCFVGQCDAPRLRLLRVAAATRSRLRVWGPHWRRRLWRHAWLRPAFSGDGAFGDDYARALSGAEIGLCLLTKLVPETTTTRSVEIPGCGAFMLAERTDDHCALFEEGVEAEYFSGAAEMADKIRFYIAHPAARGKIAAAGYARCRSSGYGNRARMRTLLAMTDALIDAHEPVAA